MHWREVDRSPPSPARNACRIRLAAAKVASRLVQLPAAPSGMSGLSACSWLKTGAPHGLSVWAVLGLLAPVKYQHKASIRLLLDPLQAIHPKTSTSPAEIVRQPKPGLPLLGMHHAVSTPMVAAVKTAGQQPAATAFVVATRSAPCWDRPSAIGSEAWPSPFGGQVPVHGTGQILTSPSCTEHVQDLSFSWKSVDHLTQLPLLESCGRQNPRQRAQQMDFHFAVLSFGDRVFQ